ncbi:hypothetical protein JZU56_00815, partial [bacterium]|nr:hypothetical protein [bacterium]
MNELNQMRQSEIDFGYRDNTLGIDFPQGTINRQGDVIAGLERFGGEAAEDIALDPTQAVGLGDRIHLNLKVMIGGAPVTQEFATQI